mgnify:CR=1 FL=1
MDYEEFKKIEKYPANRGDNRVWKVKAHNKYWICEDCGTGVKKRQSDASCIEYLDLPTTRVRSAYSSLTEERSTWEVEIELVKE